MMKEQYYWTKGESAVKKVYINRNPKVGDLVEATSNPFGYGDQKVGYEYTIVRLGHGYVDVTGERMPGGKKEIFISDGQYSVIEYQEIPKPKETHVKVYKFLGIPFGKRTTYVYE